MLMRLALAPLAVVGCLTLARADGLTPATTAAQGLCYASGTSGPRVPCILQDGTWNRIQRSTDDASGMIAPRGDGALQRLDTMVPALDIARAEIPARAIILRSFVASGYATAGDAGSGARYVRGTASGLMAVQDTAGTWWQLDLSAGEIRAGWLGVVANSPAAAVSNAVAINAGLAALGNRGGGRLILPPGNVYVGAMLLNRWDWTYLDGAGLFSAGYGTPQYPTTLVPTFAGTVVKHYSDLSGAHIVNGGGLRNFRVIGNGIATRLVEINTTWDGEYIFTAQDSVGSDGVLIYGDNLTNVPGAGSTQRMKVNIVATQTAAGAASNASAVVLDGAPRANVSINNSLRFETSTVNGVGLDLRNTDNNGIILRAFVQPGGTGRPFISRAHADLDRRARVNWFEWLATNKPGLVEGTDTAAGPSSLRIMVLDTDNGSPIPDLGTQASLVVDGVSKEYAPQIASFGGALGSGSNATGRWSMSGHLVTVFVNAYVGQRGTGSQYITLTLPIPQKDNTPDGIVEGWHNVGAGRSLHGTISGGKAYVAFNDGSYPVTGDGQQLKLKLTYEAY